MINYTRGRKQGVTETRVMTLRIQWHSNMNNDRAIKHILNVNPHHISSFLKLNGKQKDTVGRQTSLVVFGTNVWTHACTLKFTSNAAGVVRLLKTRQMDNKSNRNSFWAKVYLTQCNRYIRFNKIKFVSKLILEYLT